MGTDPLAPVTQAGNDLSTAVTDATTAIQNTVREILQATRMLKNPTTPTGEINGLATNIETSAKAIDQLALSLNQATANLTAAAGAAPTAITVSPNPIALDLNGAASQQLSVVDSDSDDVSADPTTQYVSDTPAAATVSSPGGLVTGVAVGAFKVTVTDEFGNTETVPGTVVNSATVSTPAAQAKPAK